MKLNMLTASLCVATALGSTALVATAWAQDLPQAVTTEREMVVTANPLATAACPCIG